MLFASPLPPPSHNMRFVPQLTIYVRIALLSDIISSSIIIYIAPPIYGAQQHMRVVTPPWLLLKGRRAAASRRAMHTLHDGL